MKKQNILFENRVFSLQPNTFGFGSWLDAENQHFADSAVYGSVTEGNEFHPIDDNFQTQKSIYLYDAIETYFRDLRLENIRQNELHLAFAKEIIADEHYPSYVEHWFDPVVVPGEYEGWPSEVKLTKQMVWGRSSLVGMIRECRYQAALPELREIILHDDSFSMKSEALCAIGSFDSHEGQCVVNEILGSVADRRLLMEIIMWICRYAPKELFMQNLHTKFHEHYHDYGTSALARKHFGTITQAIIGLVCTRTPTLASLTLIEEGIKHPYSFVEHTAKYALFRWCDSVARMKNVDPAVFAKVCSLANKYDVRQYESSAWKLFEKIPNR